MFLSEKRSDCFVGGNMKFLLIHVAPEFEIFSNPNESRTQSSYHPPLGILYIASALENEGHSIEIIDFHHEKDPEKKIQNSLASIDAVGFNVYTDNHTKLASIANLVKETDPNIPIIIGGPHCIFHPKEALFDIPAADVSIEGEGDLVIKDVVQALAGTKQFSELPGVHYRVKDEIKSGKPQLIVYDLDSLPFPARHLVDKYDYGKIDKSYFFKSKFTSMITSRGCPSRCRFCPKNFPSFQTYRERSVSNVVEEIQEINNRYDSVMIVDDNFLVNANRAHQIMDNLIKIGTDLDIYVEGARVDAAEPELFKKMKKAGVKHLYFGIESGNQDVLDFYNKKTTLEQIRKAIKLSNEMDFLTMGTFILGAPIETKKHIEQTIKFAGSLPLDIVVFHVLSYRYGSELWKEAFKNGLIKENEDIVVADSRRGLGNFTQKELEEFSRKASRKFYSRPNYIKREFFKFIKTKDTNFIKIGLNNFLNVVS